MELDEQIQVAPVADPFDAARMEHELYLRLVAMRRE
jgi:hypothetical protein